MSNRSSRRKGDRPRDKSRARAVARAARRNAFHRIEDEPATALLLTPCHPAAYLGPVCSGPLLVHVDGSLECPNPVCPGGTKIFHDVVDQCGDAAGVTLALSCPRCLDGGRAYRDSGGGR